MFFSYTAGVVLLSLAIYGVWCLLQDIWQWYLAPRLMRPPSSSFLVIVRNAEQEIEILARYLMREIEEASFECDAVLVDHGSEDLTPTILSRVVEDHPAIKTISLPLTARPVLDAMPLCSGSIVHVLDLTTRLDSQQFMVTICALLHEGEREVKVKGTVDD